MGGRDGTKESRHGGDKVSGASQRRDRRAKGAAGAQDRRHRGQTAERTDGPKDRRPTGPPPPLPASIRVKISKGPSSHTKSTHAIKITKRTDVKKK